MKKLSKAILLSLVALLLASMPVLAAVAYRAAYTIIESAGTPYSMLSVIRSAPNTWLAANGFMLATAQDTRIETLGEAEKPHMVVDDKTLTAVPVPANSQTNLYFTTANTAATFDIIEGYGGYITVADDADLELGTKFEIEIDDAYINTDAGGTKYLVYKEDSFATYIDGATNITSHILPGYAPTNINPYSSTSDGDIRNNNAVYNTAWDAATGTVEAGAGTLRIGQFLGFTLIKTFLYFDTSALPDDCIITSATLKLYGHTDTSTDDFLITIQNGQPDHPETPFVIGDYDKDHYSGDGGSLTTVGFSVVAYNDIALNATGLTWISKTGTTKLTIRSSEEIAGSEPVNDEYVLVHAAEEGAAKRPQLVVNYSAPEAEVTAINVPSGQHDIKTTLNAGLLEISVDSAVAGDFYDSTATTITVSPNANDWLIMDNSTTQFMPYMGYYMHTTNIGGYTLKAWYQPATIVVNTSLDVKETAGGSAVLITDAVNITQAINYWVGARVTLTLSSAPPPAVGETAICTSSTVGTITVAPAFSAALAITDELTVEFGTLVDRQGADEPGRITWGVNPAGVDVSLGGMVSEGQPVLGSLPDDPAQDILPETEVTDWFIEPAVGTTLLNNPLRPFVTMWSDNSTLTELQCWRIYAFAIILLVTVATALSVGRHQGITAIMAGVAVLGAVVLTIFPMWALVFAIGMFIGGLVMERSPSL